MTDRTALLLRAARCYAEAGAHRDAARCYDALGRSWTAAETYRQAGDLAAAAESYQRAGRPYDAARCFRALGRPDQGARCLRQHGDLLGAAWEHLLAGEPHVAEPLLGAAATGRTAAEPPARRLRLRLAQEVSALLRQHTREPLLALLPDVAAQLTGDGTATAAVRERLTLLEWGVEAADLLARFDWGARLFHTAYGSLPAGAPQRGDLRSRWEEWATDRLGGTAWLPGREADVATAGG